MAKPSHNRLGTADRRTTPTPVGMRGHLPDERLVSRRMRVFVGGVEVARNRFPAGEYGSPGFAGHFVTVHLNGPVTGAWRPEEGRARGYVEARGDVMVVPAGMAAWQAPHAESEDLNVLISDGFLRRVAAEAGADPDRLEVLHGFCTRDPALKRIGLSFLPEVEEGSLGGELYGQSLANALAVHLLREHSWLGERTKRRIAREPKPGGLSPHQYVIAQRVERAKGLQMRDVPIGEVAGIVGFSNQSHLARHFGRLTGVTPARFRREAGR
jgi:AraC family transcriptional regulator